MTKKLLLFGLIGFILGAILIGGLFTLTQPRSNEVAETTVDTRSNMLDAHFIEQMIPHHADAITMSELALERATKPEVRELAENIIQSQSEEITQMKNWYRVWFNKEVPEGEQVMNMHGMGRGQNMHMGVMGDETDIAKLEQAEDFDTEFIRQMIPHHQMAVMMANMLKNGTDRPEMKTLALNIIRTQTSEIELMRTWLREGYGN